MRFVFEDMTGRICGRWTVLSYAGKNKWSQSRWLCRCICGVEKTLVKDVLADGRSKSCGCWQKEWSSAAHRTHGDSRLPGSKKHTRLYGIWAGIIKRCHNPKSVGFKNYGGRGIRVCERWCDYANFKADMEPSYQPNLSIDRINNDGDYTPDNCRWATQKQQMRNVSYNRLVEYQGQTKPLAEWAEVLRLPYNRIRDRLKLGWTIDRAFTTPALHAGPFGKAARSVTL